MLRYTSFEDPSLFLTILSFFFHHREILGIQKYPLDWEVTGRSICYLFVLSIPYFFLVLVFEYAADGGAGGLLIQKFGFRVY